MKTGKRDYAAGFLDEWRAAWPDLDMDGAEPLIRVIRLAGILERDLVKLTQAHGINSGQFQVLAALRRRHPKPLSPSDLSRIAILTSGTMTVLLDRLEEKKLALRVRDPADRRRIDVELTNTGITLVNQILAARAQELHEKSALMSPNDRQLTSAALQSLLARIDPEADR